MHNSNPQTEKFTLQIGARGYKTRSDITATTEGYLVAGSQNMIINESDLDEKTGDLDKVETRAGYAMFGDESDDRVGTKNEFTFKTKSSDVRTLRFLSNGDLEFYLDGSYELLMEGLDGDHNCRFATVWDSAELIRRMLFVNHTDDLFSWSGATTTLASVAAGTVSVDESIAARSFLTNGTRSIRIQDSGGVWRETVYTAQSGGDFTVSTDLTGFSFDPGAPVVQSVAVSTVTPADGFINDFIRVVENHVYVGSDASSVVYMSKSTSFSDFSFSSPRLATDGWEFVLDDFMIGFGTNITSEGKESIVMFAGNDWIYRVQFTDIANDTVIAQVASVKPIVVSSGQGAVSQELIGKVGNSIIYLNGFNELIDFGSVENIATVQQTPLSDPIKPDFLAADFTGGALRYWRNNLYVTAPPSGRVFILAFRESAKGTRRFWQPPQLLPVGQLSDFMGSLIGHSPSVTESYQLFTGTNDNGKPIAFKAHFAYSSYGAREKLKNLDKYFSELYLTSNTTVVHTLLFEYLGAKKVSVFQYKGTELDFIFTPNPDASLGVNSLGTSPLGATVTDIGDFLKYRRFKKITALDFFEIQPRYEADDLDARFQILCHGPNAQVSKNSPSKITS